MILKSVEAIGAPRSRRLGLAVTAGLIILFLGLSVTPALAANPAPVQFFYLMLPEADALTVLDTINSDAATPVTTYFSIAVGVDGTYVYYDQWENGYDSDIANPANLYSSSNLGGTQIWGNGTAADGCPPNKNGAPLTCSNANDVLDAGDVVIPSNTIAIPRNSSTIRFDARDKVGASGSIAMARAAWASGSGTLNAFAHEMYPTSEWGTAYEAPVGCNTASPGTDMFEYSGLSIMAAQNGTPIRVDADGDGTWDYSDTLNEGGSYFESYRSRYGCDYVRQGARVESTDASKPIQVVLVTGDIGSNYESRDMNLLPISAYGSGYWSPVGVNTGNGDYTPGPTRLWLYNPSANGSIYVTCERYNVANTTLGPVSARGVVTIDLSNNQGAHCYASLQNGTATADNIFAVGTVDTDNGDDGQAWDWSFTLFPDDFLSTDALVGLGLGRDPTSGTNTGENGSPLWVTAACTTTPTSTYVFVDWNADGTPDLVDTDGDGNGNTDTNLGISVTRLRSVRLYDPDPDSYSYDQSGARVWSRTTAWSGTGALPATPGCKLALAWGEDPREASAAAPGLDVGTSIAPLRLVEGTKSLALKTDANNDGALSPGDTATYTLTVKNSGSIIVNNVAISDTVPANTTYVAGTTQKNVGGGWVSIPDNGSGTPFPLDVTGGVLLGDLAPGATFYVRFDVTLNAVGDFEEILNCDAAYTAAGNFSRCATSFVASRDWGDLPDSYGTSLAANGPRHSYSGLKLGGSFDFEVQGVATTGANGDDGALAPDDEDGVVLLSGAQWASGTGGFSVTVAGGPGCFNAWMDFTNDAGGAASDGNFTKTGGYDTRTLGATTYSEQIVANRKLATGTTSVTFAVPTDILGSSTVSYYFRFRLSPPDANGNCTTAIAPTGFVEGGEVEDYMYTFSPLAVPLAGFTAGPTAKGATLAWETVSEQHNAGFNVYRAPSEAGPWTQLNAGLIPSQAPGSGAGFTYFWPDPALKPGVTYHYRLDAVDPDGLAATVGITSLYYRGGYWLWLPVVGQH